MKNKSIIMVVVAFMFLIASCKKTENNSAGTVTQVTNPYHHGYGVMIDRKPPTNIPHANLDQIRSNLVNSGYLSNLTTYSTPPATVILNHPAIGNQGSTNTCVSWSEGYALMGTLDLEFPLGLLNNRSPWYIYQMNHTAINDCSDDGMTSGAAGLDILETNGEPPSIDDPSEGNFCEYTPVGTTGQDAALAKIPGFSALTTVSEIQSALAMNLPVEITINVYQSFETAFSNHTIFTGNSGSLLGGHALCIIGYNNAKNAVLVQNSWGTAGGDTQYPGCMWLDYGVLTNSSFIREIYVVTPPPQPVTINGVVGMYWSANGSGSGTITAPAGKLVHVTISAYGSSSASHLTSFTMNGAQLSGPMGNGVYEENSSTTQTFTMPTSGSVTWNGYFSESDNTGNGGISVY